MRQALVALALVPLAAACGGREAAPISPAPVATASSPPPTAAAASAPPTTAPPPACPSPQAAASVLVCPSKTRDVTLVQVLEADRARSARPTVVKKGDARERLAPRAPTKEDAAYLETAQAFVCAPHARAESIHVVEVRYGLARTYFDMNRWEESAALFDSIAREGSELAPYAAQLALESLNVLYGTFERADCAPTMRRWISDYLGTMCGGGPSDDRELCATLTKIRAELDARPR